MSIAGALRALAEKVPSVPSAKIMGEPLEAAPIKEVPQVPRVPSEKHEGQPQSAHATRVWDFQAGWWKGEDGPIQVRGWAKDGREITLLANNEVMAERLRRAYPAPLKSRN